MAEAVTDKVEDKMTATDTIATDKTVADKSATATTATDKTATVVTDKTVTEKTPTATDKPPVWGDNWRKLIAGEDEKEQRILERFADPSAVYKSFRALQQKLSSGELKSNVPFPEKGTDQEKAAWRQEAGLPESPDKYDLKFDNGLVIGEQDKVVVDDFLKAAYEANLPPAAVKKSVEWYFKSIEARTQARQESDAKFRQESEDALRAEWGNEFRKNVNMVKALIGTAPQEIQEEFMHARLANGKPLTSDPNMLKWLTGIARTINPVATVVPGADSATMANSIDDEIKTIEKTMRSDRKAYNKDAKMQERYRELLDARSRLAKQR